jgi:hypothetical protein
MEYEDHDVGLLNSVKISKIMDKSIFTSLGCSHGVMYRTIRQFYTAHA